MTILRPSCTRYRAGGLNSTEVRERATAQGIEVKDQGRVPAELVVKFKTRYRKVGSGTLTARQGYGTSLICGIERGACTRAYSLRHTAYTSRAGTLPRFDPNWLAASAPSSGWNTWPSRSKN